uniref:Uncharacterized protein n=1 Tax=Chromera velia CCMP2878 TaxID=1169474 RepID=A0A0G4I4C6_9ALVE|eukprot:Cvel_10855.t1-p1 / transcript=Cvel_10855.t1 / gene=Cvel_10855 / organism=Chromera_velia_CCMP2878 / gene_product=hypothetical protein / transcript_product=hypothetical protein / location=Cvel_scaffold664:60887-62328(+) / protein_length=183 / sequence_SO=supercontig / SO=protein_coding / is_pseudo=false
MEGTPRSHSHADARTFVDVRKEIVGKQRETAGSSSSSSSAASSSAAPMTETSFSVPSAASAPPRPNECPAGPDCSPVKDFRSVPQPLLCSHGLPEGPPLTTDLEDLFAATPCAALAVVDAGHEVLWSSAMSPAPTSPQNVQEVKEDVAGVQQECALARQAKRRAQHMQGAATGKKVLKEGKQG